jgi:hypothetical protein
LAGPMAGSGANPESRLLTVALPLWPSTDVPTWIPGSPLRGAPE